MKEGKLFCLTCHEIVSIKKNVVITDLAAKKHGNVKDKLGLQHPNWENQHVTVPLGEEWPTSHSKCSSWLAYMNCF